MIDATAIQKFQELVERGLGFEVLFDETPYDRKTWKPIAQPKEETLLVRTLGAFRDYVLSETPSFDEWNVHIQDPGYVRLVSEPRPPVLQRAELVAAKAVIPPQEKFTTWMHQEEFSIWLQTTFVETQELKDLLRLTGNLKSEHVETSRDDGVSQEVVVRTGVASVEQATIAPKWELSAWRTFHEIQQPSGWYLLRMRESNDSTALSLHPVLDASWSLKAMAGIKKLLEPLAEAGYTILA